MEYSRHVYDTERLHHMEAFAPFFCSGVGEPGGEADGGGVATGGQTGAAGAAGARPCAPAVAAGEPGELGAAPAGDDAVDGDGGRVVSLDADRAAADVH